MKLKFFNSWAVNGIGSLVLSIWSLTTKILNDIQVFSFIDNETLKKIIFVGLLFFSIYSFFRAFRSYRHFSSIILLMSVLKKLNKLDTSKYILLPFKGFDTFAKALELDEETYEEEHTWSIERWRAFYSKNDSIVYGLFDREDTEQYKCLGGISCFPILKETYDALMRRERKEIDITDEDIISRDKMKGHQYWLIPSVVVFDVSLLKISSGKSKVGVILASFLEKFLSTAGFPLRIVAVGYSPEGKALLRKFRFNPHFESDDYSIYNVTINTLEEFQANVPGFMIGR